MNRVKHHTDSFILAACVNSMSTSALVDSGADITVVSSQFVAPYTGQCMWTWGLNVAGPLPTARLTLAIGGKESEMIVAVKPEVLLGTDFPGVTN